MDTNRGAPPRSLLPSVVWQEHCISRLVLGHNPMKGWSHASEALDLEMRSHHADDAAALGLIARAEACGINTAQFGGDRPTWALEEHAHRGGHMQWIATLYGKLAGPIGPGSNLSFEDELRRILAVTPRPIAIQHFGETTDQFFFEGRLDLLRERMRRLRDTGLMIGVCTHLPEVVEEIESQGWDIDFYQTSFYTVYSSTGERAIDRQHEKFEPAARDRMAACIRNTPKPCIAFKVLGASRHCGSPEDVRAAFRYAFDHIKPTDVVCVGMWQKHADQIAANAAIVRSLLQ
jgi:hypothetical protein